MNAWMASSCWPTNGRRCLDTKICTNGSGRNGGVASRAMCGRSSQPNPGLAKLQQPSARRAVALGATVRSDRTQIDTKRLRFDVGLTDYVTMRVTNSSMDERLADGERIERRYAGALDDLAGSQLANPLATNLSIVTADRMIFVSQRSLRVA